MARKDKIAEAEYQAEWYRRPGNMEKVRAARIARAAVIVAMVREYKNRPCMDCKVQYPFYVMELDHRDPSLKLVHPHRLSTTGWTDARVKEELAKCDVVCANCHRIRTNKHLGC
jgi:hypothetical protein